MSVKISNVDFAAQPPSPTRVPAVESNVNPRASLFFFLLIALSVAFEWRSLTATLNLAWHNDQYTQILLIVPIAAGLIYLDRHILGLRAQRDLRSGLTFLGSAALIALFPSLRTAAFMPDVELSSKMFALILWWIGAFLLCFGPYVGRAFLFPLCLLLGLVPMPQAVVDSIVRTLQQGSSLAAYWLFTAAGVPTVQDGFRLSIPSLTIEIAQECSSIRSSLMLLLTTIVLAHLVLKSPWRKVLIVAIALPLSVAKNGLRIFTIAILGTHVDAGYLNGRLHRQGGGIFLAISLLAVGVLLFILRQTEHRSAYPKLRSPEPRMPAC
jgi:exosortase